MVITRAAITATATKADGWVKLIGWLGAIPSQLFLLEAESSRAKAFRSHVA